LYYLDAEELGFTALIKASVEAEPEALQKLVNAGATVDLETSKGFTALSWACVMGHRDIVFVLLKNDAIIDYPSVTEGKTPLMQAAANGRVECVILLLQSVFDRASHACHLRRIDAESKPFRTEIERSEFLSVDWVDEYECALTRRDKRGRTAMDYAKLSGCLEAVQALQTAYQRYVCVRAAPSSVCVSRFPTSRRVSDRRDHLEAVKRDAKIVMCPLACGHKDRADLMTRHVRFMCRRRPVKCVYCSVIVKEEVLVEVPCFSFPLHWMVHELGMLDPGTRKVGVHQTPCELQKFGAGMRGSTTPG
jgi:ankyrin repeat protein